MDMNEKYMAWDVSSVMNPVLIRVSGRLHIIPFTQARVTHTYTLHPKHKYTSPSLYRGTFSSSHNLVFCLNDL